jgi:hypothetical protein
MAGRMDMIALIDVPGVPPLWNLRSERLANRLHDPVKYWISAKKSERLLAPNGLA